MDDHDLGGKITDTHLSDFVAHANASQQIARGVFYYLIRDELQRVLAQAQSQERWWMNNLATLENEVRSDADERHEAIGAAEAEWHQQRMQLESAMGPADAQSGWPTRYHR